MRAGAADYLSKERLEPAILERALRYAVERSRAQEALRRSHDDLLAILNRLQIGVDPDRRGRVGSRS